MEFPEINLRLYPCKNCGSNEGVYGEKIEKGGYTIFYAVCKSCGARGKPVSCTDPSLLQFVIAKSWNEEMSPYHIETAVPNYKRKRGKLV